MSTTYQVEHVTSEESHATKVHIGGIGPFVPVEEIITRLAASPSSPNLESYSSIFDTDASKVTFVHEKKGQRRLDDLALRMQGLEVEMAWVKGKFAQMEDNESLTMEWEVRSRIAQVINVDYINSWLAETQSRAIIKPLIEARLHFLPKLLTAEAVRWCNESGEEMACVNLYSVPDRQRHLRTAQTHAPYQVTVDWVWNAMDPVDRDLMLMSWAKRPASRNAVVHYVPSVGFAESLLERDQDLGVTLRRRALDIIHSAQDHRGNEIFPE